MTSAVYLLPGNATPLEEALTTMLDTRGRLAPRLAAVAGFADDVDAIPDDWLPWIVLNEGLDVLSPYLPAREVLRQGRPWLKELGSEAAIVRALGWVGQHNVTVHYEPDADEHFDLFQVELATPVTSLTDAARISELICLSKATSDILGRVRSGLDGDAFRLDHSRLDGPDQLDDWVGVRIPGLGRETYDGPITWSFGERRVIRTTGGSVAVTLRINETACLISQPDDGFRIDQSALDDELLEPDEITVAVIVTGTETIGGDNRQAPWPHRPLPGYAPLDFAPAVNIKMTRED